MSKRKKQDAGYPFDTGDWAKWTNRKRLEWLVNLRDKLRDKYKGKYNVPDEAIEQMSANIVTMQKIVEVEESNPQLDPGFAAKPPAEKAKLTRIWLGDLSVNDYEKARIVGFTPEDIEKQWDALEKWERDIAEWQKREDARKILGFRPAADRAKDAAEIQFKNDIDDTELKKAFASGDEEAVDREWKIWIAKLEARAERDPVFAKWFEDFRADQEKLLRWDEVIGDDSE